MEIHIYYNRIRATLGASISTPLKSNKGNMDQKHISNSFPIRFSILVRPLKCHPCPQNLGASSIPYPCISCASRSLPLALVCLEAHRRRLTMASLDLRWPSWSSTQWLQMSESSVPAVRSRSSTSAAELGKMICGNGDSIAVSERE